MEKEFVTSSESIDTPSGGGNSSASFFKKKSLGNSFNIVCAYHLFLALSDL